MYLFFLKNSKFFNKQLKNGEKKQKNPEKFRVFCGMYWNRTSDLMPVKHAL